jgi:hypothetical protein
MDDMSDRDRLWFYEKADEIVQKEKEQANKAKSKSP